MLELTADAAEAIEGILAAPGLPESAGMRIAPAEGISLEAETGDVQVAVAEAPSETDEVIEADGALVFVDEAVADLVDDKVLDAMIVGDRVGFTLNVQ